MSLRDHLARLRDPGAGQQLRGGASGVLNKELVFPFRSLTISSHTFLAFKFLLMILLRILVYVDLLHIAAFMIFSLSLSFENLL